MRKLHEVHAEDGSLKALYFPESMDDETKISIAKAKGFQNPKFSLAPLAEISPSGMSKHKVTFRKLEHRAASKSIIEVLDWQTRSMGKRAYARLPQLRSARRYIRNGSFNEYIEKHESPMMDFEEEFKSIFGTSDDEFSNCVLICNDSRANRCFGLIQIAQTMPLGLCLGEAVEDTDFSLLYEASIIAKGKSQSRLINEVVISYKDYKRVPFYVSSRASADFAYDKLRASIDNQLGRATVMIDLHADEPIAEMLRQLTLDATARNSSSKTPLLRTICEPLLRMRFSKHSITDSEWDGIFLIPEPSGFDSVAFLHGISEYKSLTGYVDPILKYYRDLVQVMVGRFGYPRILTPL